MRTVIELTLSSSYVTELVIPSSLATALYAILAKAPNQGPPGPPPGPGYEITGPTFSILDYSLPGSPTGADSNIIPESRTYKFSGPFTGGETIGIAQLSAAADYPWDPPQPARTVNFQLLIDS